MQGGGDTQLHHNHFSTPYTYALFVNMVAVPMTIIGATTASPIVLTTSSERGFQPSASVTCSGIGGNTAANGTFGLTRIDSTHFALNGSTANGNYTGGATCITPYDTAGLDFDHNIVDQQTIAGLYFSSGAGANPTPVWSQIDISHNKFQVRNATSILFDSKPSSGKVIANMLLITENQMITGDRGTGVDIGNGVVGYVHLANNPITGSGKGSSRGIVIARGVVHVSVLQNPCVSVVTA